MIKKIYYISKMDCPSEETLIRVQLENIPEILSLNFDLENRTLEIYQAKENHEIEKRIRSLNLGCEIKYNQQIENNYKITDQSQDWKLLWWVLGINFVFFIIEMFTGIISKSMGLVADSLDMLADSFVYGLSLWAVGSTTLRKKKVARLSGYFQILLAITGLFEIIRRFVNFEATPDYHIMIIVSFFALIANSIALYLLKKSKSREAHMKASMIFTSNDVIINSGVMLAGFLVMFTNSKYPDLIIGTIVFLIVVRGAIRILKLGK